VERCATMKSLIKLAVGALAIGVAGLLDGATYTGTVISVDGDVAKVAMNGDVFPAIGARGEIFFKLAGSDDEVSVASGSALQIDHGDLLVKIENATGAVEKGHLVRFGPVEKSRATETPSPPSISANPLRGDWTGAAPGGAKISFSFKDDNTLLWVVEEETSVKSVSAKFRVDTTVTPHVVEFFDFDSGEMKGHTLYGLFEIQSDGRLKIDAAETRDRGFSEGETLFLSRATTPIVVPPKRTQTSEPSPTPENTPATPSTSTRDTRPPDEQKIALGDYYYNAKDFDAAIEAYTEAIKLNPKNAWAYKERGHALFQVDDYEAAIADWNKALTLPLEPEYKKGIEESIENAKSLKHRQKKWEPKAKK
jgi:TPR repeat